MIRLLLAGAFVHFKTAEQSDLHLPGYEEVSKLFANFQLRWVQAASEIKNHLWSSCFPPPVEGKWWYETLESSSLTDQFEFLYGIISSNNVDVGIVPAFVMNVPIAVVAPPAVADLLGFAGKFMPSLNYQRTLFIGSPFSDEGTVGLVRPLHLGQVSEHIHKAAKTMARKLKAPMIVWKDFAPDTHPHLDRLAQKMGLFKIASFPGAILHLKEGAGIEQYFESLKRSRRQKLRKKIRRSSELVDLAATVESTIDQATMERVFELFWQTYTKGKTKFERLGIEFFQEIAKTDVVRWVLLRDAKSGELVAFMLCFQVGKRIINKFIGIDYSKDSEWFLYFRLWEAAVKWASSQEVTELQSGQTGYSAKIEVGHELVSLNNYCQHSQPLIHQIFSEVAKKVSWSSLDHDLAVYVKAHQEASD